MYTLAQAFGVEGELSGIARQGSGSACRSMYGGFVQWIMGKDDDGKDSLAQQVEPETHWPELRILVLVVGLSIFFFFFESEPHLDLVFTSTLSDPQKKIKFNINCDICTRAVVKYEFDLLICIN